MYLQKTLLDCLKALFLVGKLESLQVDKLKVFITVRFQTRSNLTSKTECSVRSCTPIGGCDLTGSPIEILFYQ